MKPTMRSEAHQPAHRSDHGRQGRAVVRHRGRCGFKAARARMRGQGVVGRSGRLQKSPAGWLFLLLGKIAGWHVSRVPLSEIEKISCAVHLKCSAEKLGLHRVEDRVRAWVPRMGAM